MNEHSIIPAVVATCFVAGCIVIDLRHNLYRLLSGRSVVLVSVIYWYLVEALKRPRALEEYTQDEYAFGLLCVVVAVGVFVAAYATSRLALFSALARRLPLLDEPRVLWYLMLSAMAVGFGSLLIYLNFNILAFFDGLTGMTQRWSGSIERGRYGSWWTILFELQAFLWAAVPLAVCLLFTRRATFTQKIVAVMFIAWMFLRALFSGTRSPLMVFALPIGAGLFWSASPRLRRVLLVVGVPMSLIGGYFLSAIIVAGRNEGKFDTNAAVETEYVGVEMFRELLFVIRAESDGMPAQHGRTYFTQLVNPIPRAIWPDKPVADAGLIMARAYGAVDRFGEPTMTISPGFLGEAYLNFGFLGLLIVPAIAGIVVRSWDRLLPLASASLPSLLVFAAGLPTIMASGRSFNFANYYGLIVLFLMLCAFDWLFGSRIRRNNYTGYRSALPSRRGDVSPRRVHTVLPVTGRAAERSPVSPHQIEQP